MRYRYLHILRTYYDIAHFLKKRENVFFINVHMQYIMAKYFTFMTILTELVSDLPT